MAGRVPLWVGCLLFALVLFGGCAVPAKMSEAPVPKALHVVECGHGSPDPLYYARNIRHLERRGHNGIGLIVKWPREAAGNLGYGKIQECVNWQTWTKKRITDEMIAGAIADLRSTSSAHFTRNTIPIYTYPRPSADVMDWDDDAWWDTICHNAR